MGHTLACQLTLSLCVCVCVCLWAQLLSHVPRTVAHQAPLSMEFSRQASWSGLSFPSPQDLPDPGIELESLDLLCGRVDSSPLGHLGSPTL